MSAFGAFGLLEPLIENSSNAWGTGQQNKERDRKDYRYDTLELERQGIGAKVDGARAAGIHPLAVLGNVGGYSAPIPAGSASFSGTTRGMGSQDAKPQASPGLTAEDRETRGLQNDLLRAQIRTQDALAENSEYDAHNKMLQLSERRMATQPGQAPALRSLTDRDNIIEGQGTSLKGGYKDGRLRPGIDLKNNEILAASPQGVTIGTHGGASEIRFPLGGTNRSIKLRMPSEKASEALEDLELAKYGAIAAMNADKVGTAFKDFFVDDVPWALKGFFEDYKRAFHRKFSQPILKGKK